MGILVLVLFLFDALVLSSLVPSSVSNVQLLVGTNKIKIPSEISVTFQTSRSLNASDQVIINLPRFSRQAGLVPSSNLIVSPSLDFRAAWVEGTFAYNGDGISQIVISVLPNVVIPQLKNVRINFMESNGIYATCGFPSSVSHSSSYSVDVKTDIPTFSTFFTSGLSTLSSITDDFSYFPSVGPGCGVWNDCSGHGLCNFCSEECECVDGFGSNTDLLFAAKVASKRCNARVCPAGQAIGDVPTGRHTAHALAECSNHGTCNRLTGKCSCYSPFSGDACEEMTCPTSVEGEECSGHGSCRTMASIAAGKYEAITDINVYGTLNERNASAWDHSAVRGCVCTSSWPVGFGSGEQQLGEYYGADCSKRRCPSGDNPTTCDNEENCENLSQYDGEFGALVGETGNLCHIDCSSRGICDSSSGQCSCFSGFYGSNCAETESSVDRPDCTPSGQPTSMPTFTSYPSAAPNTSPSSAPSTSPTHHDLRPSNLLSVNYVNKTRTTISVNVQLERYGVAYCGAYVSNATVGNNVTQPQNTEDVLRLQHFAIAVDGIIQLTLESLIPATYYNIYCASISDVGRVSSFLQTDATALMAVETLCCRDIFVDLSVRSMLQYDYEVNSLTVTMPHLPVDSLDITMSVKTTVDDVFTNELLLYPYNLQFNLSSGITEKQITIQSKLSGLYTIHFALAGTSKHFYNFVFLNSMDLKVTDEFAIPDPPILLSALFSDSGGLITVLFDSDTDRGGLNNYFNCPSLLDFVGSSDSQCQWADDRTLVIYPSILVYPNTNFSVLPLKIYAQCPPAISTAECHGQSVPLSVSDTPILISPPKTPATPIVILSAPSEVTSCEPLFLDLSMASGSVGRPWRQPSFELFSSDTMENKTALLQFLNVDYQISPPVQVPGELLNHNTYTFEVVLCNFLEACGYSTVIVTVLAPDPMYLKPTVTILGSVSKTMRRKDSLLLNSDGYTIDCDGVVYYNDLSYEWSVYKENIVPTIFPYEQVDPAKFFIPSDTALANTWYFFTLVVTNDLNGQSTSVSTTVNVLLGNVIAVIAGGTTLSLQYGNQLVIDGSASYDEDNNLATGLAAGLSFRWSCNQLLPVFSDVCPFPYSSKDSFSTDFVIVNSTDSFNSNATAQFTLTVSGSSSRIHSAFVDVVVRPELSPIVTLDNVVSPFDSATRLSLTGSLHLSYPCTYFWSVSPALASSLSSIALTPVTSEESITDTLINVYLAIPANALGAFTTYSFSLSCGSGEAHIYLSTGGSPINGQFEISPQSGVELNTSFTMLASNWYDEQLPLTYLFFYLSESATQLVTNGQSERPYASTVLPGGNITCSVNIINFVGAFSSTEAVVTVESKSQEVSQLQAYVNAQLTANTGNNNGIQQTISTVSVLINAVNCSESPDCIDLNRDECSDVSHTCGACLESFVGTNGPDNSFCVANDVDLSEPSTGNCAVDSDCTNPLDVCTDGNCVTPSKTCGNDCFAHGNCTFIFKATGAIENDCKVTNSSCGAVCVCDDNYSGGLCDKPIDEANENSLITETLLTSLNTLSNSETPTVSVVSSWITNLDTLTTDPYVLTNDSYASVLKTAERSMTSAANINMTYSQASTLLTIVDSTATQGATLKVFDNSLRLSTASLLDDLSLIAIESLVPGEEPLFSVGENFKMKTEAFAAKGDEELDLSLSIPQSPLDILLNVTPSKVIVQGNGGSAGSSISVVENRIGLYGDDTNFNSNPVRISGGKNLNLSSNAIFIMQNARVTVYPVVDVGVAVKTRCFPDIVSVHVHQCFEGYNVTHNCTGTSGELSTYCPIRHYLPSCNVIEGIKAAGTGGCSVVSYTDTMVSCSCPLSGLTDARRLADSFAPLEVVTITVFDAEIFPTNITSGPQTVYISAGLFLFVWFVGFYLVGFRYTRNHIDKENPVKTVPIEDAAIASADSSYRDLVCYVESIIPAVFNRKTMFENVEVDLWQQHPYLSVFSVAQSHREEITKMYATVQLLTTISFSFFLIAVFNELHNPLDDHSCHEYTSPSACTNRVLPFDSTQTYCSWETGYTGTNTIEYCAYNKVTLSFQAFALFSMIVAIISAVVQYPLKYCLQVIKAPFKVDVSIAVSPSVVNVPGDGINPCQDHQDVRMPEPVLASADPDGRRSSVNALPEKRRTQSFSRVTPDIIHSRRRSLLSTTEMSEEDGTPQSSLVKNVQLDVQRRETRRTSMRTFALSRVTNDCKIAPEPLPEIECVSSENSSDDDHSVQDLHVDVESSEEEDDSAESSTDSPGPNDSAKNPFRRQGSVICKSESGNIWYKNVKKKNKVEPVILSEEDLLANESIHIDEDCVEIPHMDDWHAKHAHVPIEDANKKVVDGVFRDFQFQYSILVDDSDRRTYLKQWNAGLSSENEGALTKYGMCKFNDVKYTEFIIRNEIASARQVSNAHLDVLAGASEPDIGLELIKLFILDLIGRDSEAAKIFVSTHQACFTEVVYASWVEKAIAVSSLLLLNALFVYYCVVWLGDRDMAWQRNYLAICLIHFVLVILVYETITIAVIEFVIPRLIVRELCVAFEIVRNVLFEMTKHRSSEIDAIYSPYKDISSKENEIRNIVFLNSPSLFFASSQVAQNYPNLLESAIVMSYETYLPGVQLSNKLNKIGANRRDEIINEEFYLPGNSLLFPFLAPVRLMFLRRAVNFLKWFGTTPVERQKFTFQIAQPLVFSSFFVLTFYHWEWVLSVSLVILLLVLYRQYGFKKIAQEPERNIVSEENVLKPSSKMLVSDKDSDFEYAVSDDEKSEVSSAASDEFEGEGDIESSPVQTNRNRHTMVKPTMISAARRAMIANSMLRKKSLAPDDTLQDLEVDESLAMEEDQVPERQSRRTTFAAAARRTMMVNSLHAGNNGEKLVGDVIEEEDEWSDDDNIDDRLSKDKRQSLADRMLMRYENAEPASEDIADEVEDEGMQGWWAAPPADDYLEKLLDDLHDGEEIRETDSPLAAKDKKKWLEYRANLFVTESHLEEEVDPLEKPHLQDIVEKSRTVSDDGTESYIQQETSISKIPSFDDVHPVPDSVPSIVGDLTVTINNDDVGADDDLLSVSDNEEDELLSASSGDGSDGDMSEVDQEELSRFSNLPHSNPQTFPMISTAGNRWTGDYEPNNQLNNMMHSMMLDDVDDAECKIEELSSSEFHPNKAGEDIGKSVSVLTRTSTVSERSTVVTDIFSGDSVERSEQYQSLLLPLFASNEDIEQPKGGDLIDDDELLSVSDGDGGAADELLSVSGEEDFMPVEFFSSDHDVFDVPIGDDE